MTLNQGTKLGPYEVLSPLGAGGMGEVYRATDTRLDREVAIKVLPEAVANDPERTVRFQREAKVLASLNHPNIASIYGFEEAGDKRFLVMELVEGATLADRLHDGALSVEDSLTIGRQIAEALEAAHERGIVHRDLKPANVKITPEGVVKVLDFGLAKAMAVEERSTTEIVNSPTITAGYTKAGVILGTAAYMSPEQARGRPVDRRTDIWSFGVVMYECLSGHRPFEGETATDLIAKILERDADWGALPATTPTNVRMILQRCMQKDRKQRLRDIGEAWVVLDGALAGDFSISGITPVRPKPKWRSALPWAVCAILLAATAVLWLRGRAIKQPVMRLSMNIPDSQALSGIPGMMMDISPDGTKVVFAGDSSSGRQLYLRHLNQADAIPLPNTDDAMCPIFSPNGEWIAFGQKGKLRKVSVLGGPATTICDAQDVRGGSWGNDDTIVFSPNPRSGVWKVSAAGGEPTKLTDAGLGESTPTHRWPQILPDGKTAIFTATDKNSEYIDAKIIAVSLDKGEQRVVLSGANFARYIPTGHLVFARSGSLMAVPFDPQSMTVSGAPIPVLEGVLSAPTFGSSQFVFSPSGTLIYLGGASGGEQEYPVWIDQSGNETPLSEHKRDYSDVRISPDGKRLACAIMENGNADIWILELARDSFTRFTFDESVDQNPRWSPDGKWIIFASNRGKTSLNLYRQPADGTGEAERLTTSENPQTPSSFSPDGSKFLFIERRAQTDSDIMLLPLDVPQATPEALLATSFFERAAQISPDGKWMTYISNESGTVEVYARPFLRPGAKIKISAGFGGGPKWSPDGKELFYWVDREIKVVSVTDAGDALEVSTPKLLFETKHDQYFGPCDVSADGTKLLFYRPAGDVGIQSQQPTVVVNWFEELKAKAPTRK